jgi:hypothetical protein
VAATSDNAGLTATDCQLKAPRTGEAGADAILAVEVSPLLVVPFVSESAGAALTEAGWSWGDEHGNFDLRAAGLVVRQRRASSPPLPRRRTLPHGSGSHAIVRALIGLHGDDDVSVGATALAGQADVSRPIVARDLDIAGRLKAAGYHQVAGDRFERPVPDIPAGVSGRAPAAYCAAIDVLVPAYTSRARRNVRVGPDLLTTEVPGLQIALARAPVELALDLRRLNGDLLAVMLLFPDTVSALTLKAFATTVRTKPTDIMDVWRCLEICFAAQVDAAAFSRGATAQGAAIIMELFKRRDSPGMQALIAQQGISGDAALRAYSRVRALIAHLLSLT